MYTIFISIDIIEKLVNVKRLHQTAAINITEKVKLKRWFIVEYN